MRVEIICIIFFISLINIKCMNDFKSENIFNNNEVSILDIGKITYEEINNEKNFTLNTLNSLNDRNVLINFFSINCDIKIETYINGSYVNDKINNIRNNDSISIYLESKEIDKSEIKVTCINNNKFRACPLVINAIYKENSSLEFTGNKPTVLFFDKYLEEIKISYDFTIDDFTTFSFILNDIAKFRITYSYGGIIKVKNISNSNKIFFPNLSEIKENKIINLTIRREDHDENPILLTLKVFTNNSGPMILQSNYLNQGFVTSSLKYQYFYINISKDDEGEIMLHDKREKGKLFARICNQSENNCSAENIYGYMNEDEATNNIEFDEHKKRINFRYTNLTEKCEEGCLLLITYENGDIISEKNNNTNIGYDFTLLVRIWNNENWNTLEIINIPNDEYIFGIFDKNYINHHYYSAFISNKTEKIFLQIKSNHLVGFAGKGKKKLNTYYYELKNTIELNIEEEMIPIPRELINENNYISFTFRPEDYFGFELCFYYFRIFQLKREDELILPMDSNYANSLNINLKLNLNDYYYFILKNDYNELSLDYTISDLNSATEINYYIENNDYEVDISQDKLNKITSNNSLFDTIFNPEIENINNLTYILFRFKFQFSRNNKRIFSTIYNNKEKIKPQIYSAQLYQLDDNTIFDFSILEKYSLTIGWVKGEGEFHALLNNDNVLKLNKNNYNKPYSFFVKYLKNVTVINNKDFVFLMSVNYMTENNEIKEIEAGVTVSELIEYNNNPLYYSIKNNNETIYFNYKLLDTNYATTDFSIKGMLGNNSIINEIKRGNSDDFIVETEGYYDICSKNGFLELNPSISNIKEYALNSSFYIIQIDISTTKRKTNLLIEIFAIDMKFNNTIDIPVNQFISASFNLKEENKYIFHFGIKGTTQIDTIIMEFSKNYKGVDIDIIVDSNQTLSPIKSDGFDEYIFDRSYDVINSINIILNKGNSVNTTEIPKGFFMLRYYYNDTDNYDNFEFNKKFNILNKDNKNNITLKFNSSSIENVSFFEDPNKKFQIYANIFPNETGEELLNTTSFFNSKSMYGILKANITNNDSFIFNIPMDHDTLKSYKYALNMQIKVAIDNDNDYQQNKIFAYLLELDLSELKSKNGIPTYVIIIIVVVVVIIIIVAIFLIVYYRMRKKNQKLENQITEFALVKKEEEDDVNII